MFFTPLLQGAAQQQAGGTGLFLRNVSSASGGASINPGKPANTQPTDVLVAVLTGQINSPNLATASSGWTSIPSATVLPGNGRIFAWWALGSVADTAFTDPQGGFAGCTVVIYAFAGADTTNPIRAGATSEEYGTTATAPSVSANAGDSVVYTWYDWQWSQNFGPASPGGLVDRINRAVGDTRALSSTIENLAATGATPAQTRSATNFNGKRTSVIAIAAAPTTPTITGVHPLKTPWTRQPQGPVEIDARYGQVDLVYTPASAAKYQWSGNHTGFKTESVYGVAHLATTQGETLTSPRVALPGAVSMLAVVKFNNFNGATFGTTGGTGAVIYSQRELDGHRSPTLCVTSSSIAASSPGFYKLWFGTDSSAVANGRHHSTLIQTGVWYVVAASADANGVIGVAVNGVVQNNLGAPVGVFNSNWTGGPARLSGNTVWTGGSSVEIALFARFRRALSIAELSELTRDRAAPWKIFKPTRRLLGTIARTQGTTGVHPLRTRQTRQPQASAQIDWSNPITRGIFAASLPSFDAIKGRLDYTNISGPRLKNSPVGRLFSGFNGTSSYITYANETKVTMPLTVAFHTIYDNTQQAQNFVSQGGASNGGGWAVRGGLTVFQFTLGGVSDYYIDSPFSTSGLYHVCITVSGNNGTLIGYINGKQVGSPITVGTMSPASTGLVLGAVDLGPGKTNFLAAGTSIGNVQIFNRALSANEVASLARNPHQVFKPTRRLLGTAVISSVTIYRPTSDITTTGWTASSGSVLYDMVDEVTPSDADYILSPELVSPAPTVIFSSTKYISTSFPTTDFNYFFAPPSTGSTLIIVAAEPQTPSFAAINSVTDNYGGTYVKDASASTFPTNMSIWRRASQIPSSPTLPFEVTFSVVGSGTVRAHLYEVSNLAASSVLETGISDFTTPTGFSHTLNVQTLSDNCAVFVCFAAFNTAASIFPPSGWETVALDTNPRLAYKAGVGPAGTYTVTANSTAAGGVFAAAVYKKASASFPAATFGIGSVPADSYTVSVRARKTAPDGQVRVVMKDAGGTSVGASAWQPLSLSFTTYSLSVTTTGTATQLSIEVQQ